MKLTHMEYPLSKWDLGGVYCCDASSVVALRDQCVGSQPWGVIVSFETQLAQFMSRKAQLTPNTPPLPQTPTPSTPIPTPTPTHSKRTAFARRLSHIGNHHTFVGFTEHACRSNDSNMTHGLIVPHTPVLPTLQYERGEVGASLGCQLDVVKKRGRGALYWYMDTCAGDITTINLWYWGGNWMNGYIDTVIHWMMALACTASLGELKAGLARDTKYILLFLDRGWVLKNIKKGKHWSGNSDHGQREGGGLARESDWND